VGFRRPRPGAIQQEDEVSHKRTADKERPNWPWTARQRRQKLGGRPARKRARHV